MFTRSLFCRQWVPHSHICMEKQECQCLYRRSVSQAGDRILSSKCANLRYRTQLCFEGVAGHSFIQFVRLQSIVLVLLYFRFMTYVRFRRGRSWRRQLRCLSVLLLDLLTSLAHWQKSEFLSRVSTLTRDIDIAILSVRPSVRPSVCLSICLSVTFRYQMKTA